jgi:lipopolysaccharide/colanic/teichoic acid biosynthesis glycosyltransferase
MESDNKNITVLSRKRGVCHILTYSIWKSLIDWLLSLVVLAGLSPFLALIAIGIVIDSPGSPVFAQERVGKNGRRFTAYKFRTMNVNGDDSQYKAYLKKYVVENAAYKVDQNGQGIYKVTDTHQVTRVGALLRKTNLDELPQFLNVLKGEMSIVGPRPDVPFAVDMYQDWQRERLRVPPGITGLWQVSQRRNLSFDDMVRLDIEYVNQQSMLLDAKILLLTVRAILRADGS